MQKNLTEYLWKGLDRENFDIINIVPKDDRNAIIVMRDNRPNSKLKWCVQHNGNGHYFETYKDLLNYLKCSKMSKLKK